MQKIIEQLKENKKIHYTIIIVVGILLSIGLMHIQIRDTHDGFLHFLRIMKTGQLLEKGEGFPIIVPSICNGAGYAMNLFYPPFATYLPLIVKLFVPTYAATLKVFGAICIIFSGITMYQLVYQVTKKRTMALFAAFFYMIAPYKLANVYKRYAIGEFIALGFIPLVFLGLYNVLQEDGKKHYFIAIGAIGLMFSHTISTFYTAIFCVIYLLFFIKRLKDKEVWKKFIINVFFILLVTACFWMPLMEAKRTTDYAIFEDSIMSTNSEYVQGTTLEFYQLFWNKEEANGTIFKIGIPTLLLLLSTFYTIRKMDKKYKDTYIIFMLFAYISLMMSLKIFPWKWMPNFLCKLQYAWRMLGFFNLFTSVLCGINMAILLQNLVKKETYQVMISIAFIIVSIFYTSQQMYVFYAKDGTADAKYENEMKEAESISHFKINREYLPVKALNLQRTYMLNKEDKCYIMEGNAQIIEEEKNRLHMEITVEQVEQNTEIEIPYIYYPGYKAVLKTGDEELALQTQESKNGYLSVVLPEQIEEAVIVVEYKGTTILKIGYLLTAIGTISFILYIIKEKKGTLQIWKKTAQKKEE